MRATTLIACLACFTALAHAVFPITMNGPMTGPGQVPWDADLGVPMVWNGGIWFLEGDTFNHGNNGIRVAGNAIGGCKPLPCKVQWYLNGAGNPIMYITWPPKVISCVPAGAIEANGLSYIMQMNVIQWGNGPGLTHAWSMLLRGTPTPANYIATSCYFEVDSKFVNTGFVVSGTTVYIYGTGLYRVSDVYLASAPANALDNKSAWRYYHNGNWSPNEGDATAIITGAVAGEISAIYSTHLQEYVVTAFNFKGPGILYMYRSKTFSGPWSKDIIFEEGWAYPWRQGMTGVYGGYMVPDQGVDTSTLFLTMSFWVPYRTYMIEIDLKNLGSRDVIVGVTDMSTGMPVNTNETIVLTPEMEERARNYNPHNMSEKADLVMRTKYEKFTYINNNLGDVIN